MPFPRPLPLPCHPCGCRQSVWGTAGPRSDPPGAECLPGLFRGPCSRQRVRLAPKPVDLLSLLCRITPEGGTVLDPFAGSATTALACLATGRRFIGCEIDPVHFATAEKRIREADG